MSKSKTTSKTVSTKLPVKTAKKTAKPVVKPEAKVPCLKVIKLYRDNQPVGYVAFQTNTDGKIEATIAAKNPKDEWNHKRGLQIVTRRFAKPKNRILLTPKRDITTFEDTRRAVLECLSTKDDRVSHKARKAAVEMLQELNGDNIRGNLKSFLEGSAAKLTHKVKLVQSILDEIVKAQTESVKKQSSKSKVVRPTKLATH